MKPAETDQPARGSAVDNMVDQIRSLIRTRKLKVGDVLPAETELASMFGASRNTAREAFRVLRALGIVESRPKIGTVITDRRCAAMMDAFSFALDISADTFQDIQGFRRLFEVNLAERLIATVTPAEIESLVGINEAMNRASDREEAARLDYEFHCALVDLAHNRTLSEVYRILDPVIRRLMETGKTMRRAFEGAHAEHAAIIEALRAKDRLGYAYHMNRHLDAGLEFIAPAAQRPDGDGDGAG